MTYFKDKEAIVPNVMTLIAILVLVGATLYSLLWPVPNAAVSGHSLTRRSIADEIADATEQGASAKKAIMPHLWQGDPNSVSAGVLAVMTKEASSQSLKLGAFRPQTSQNLGSVIELPYAAQLSGPYPKVRSVLAHLDAPGSKIALSSVQIASSEQASNEVTATLGVSAYLASDPQLMSGGSKPASAVPALAATRATARPNGGSSG